MQSALTNLAGVHSAKIDTKAGEVFVRFDADKVNPEEMAKVVTESGFDATAKGAPN